MTTRAFTQRVVPGTWRPPGLDRTVHERLEGLQAQMDQLMDSARAQEIAQRLRDALRNSPYTQDQVADGIGVKTRTLQFWLAGDKGVTRANVERVCAFIDADADDVWFGPPELTDAERFTRLEAKVDWLIEQAGGDPMAFAAAVEGAAAAAAGTSERAPDAPSRSRGATPKR